MADLVEGLSEVLVDAQLARKLSGVDPDRIDLRPLRAADAADRIALHLARQVERAIGSLAENERVQAGTEIARRFLSELAERVGRAVVDIPETPAEVLSAIHARNPDGSVKRIAEPLIGALRHRDTIEKLSAVFDGYWESGDFEPHDADRFAAVAA